MTDSQILKPNANSALDAWLAYWQTIHASAIDMGLERVRPVAVYLDVLQPAAPVITVAGTNGKGSTTTVIAAIYHAAGLRVGLYQSPHILHFNERIRLDGVPVSDDVLIQAFVLVEAARVACDLTLSFFEATTLAAFLIFKQQACDVWVLEVGLGGRLDVVNLIDPDVAVITNIGVDHVEWLGDNREAIGFEKAGILRAGIPLIFGDVDMPDSVRLHAASLGCPIIQYGTDYSVLQLPVDSEHVTQRPMLQSYFANPALTVMLPVASLALQNVATAISAALLAGIKVTEDELNQGIERAKLAGRFEQHHFQGKRLIADVAHNPHGVNFLLQQLADYRKKHVTRHIHAIFSMLADKDIAAVVAMAHGVIDHWHVAPMDVPRAASATQLAAALHTVPTAQVTLYATLADAMNGASEATAADDLLLAWGSFHTLEAIYPVLARDQV
jgi:dihydrofolate synthase/folylpolyglutamate synthase